jgi:copper oxidase (laccase) domain-containing protein
MAASFGTDPGDLRAGVGPCVAAASYEVGPQEVSAVAAAFPDAPELLLPTHDGHARFDLPGAVHRRLVAAGVPVPAIAMAGIDTRTTTDTWFSDRAERPCGRFALVAAID